MLLVDFAVGINSCSHNIRKITPVLTESPAPSAVTDLQLQVHSFSFVFRILQ